MSNTYFTKDHEYIRVDGDTGVVGVTDHAQQALGDIVYVELPQVGAAFKRGDQVAVVERCSRPSAAKSSTSTARSKKSPAR